MRVLNQFMIKPVLMAWALFFCFGFNSNTLFAQQQETLEGIVLEESAKGKFLPVYLANVHWMGTQIGGLTDSAGFFKLPFLEPGKKLIVSYTGYNSDTLLILNSLNIKVILRGGTTLGEAVISHRTKGTEIYWLDPLKTRNMTEKELFKAACCNLSESFETNPAVDVSYADAVTGTRQIQMLGLAGKYTQINRENLPSIRGLAIPYGLSFTPGPFVNSIQVTKGIGSVVNGFESMAGQINVEMKNAEEKNRTYLNVYASGDGRSEMNLNFVEKINPNWTGILLAHGSMRPARMDRNNDGYLDNPLGNQINLVNKWEYSNQKGAEIMFGGIYVKDDKIGGQKDFNPKEHKLGNRVFGVGIETERAEIWSKTGFVFPQKKYQSMGLQLQGISHQQNSYFGLNKYSGKQKSLYANLIYQSIIKTTDHKFKTGLSFMADNYNEDFNALNFKRTEEVPGAFFEYTYSFLEKLTVIAGIRGDHHNKFGWFATPRLHARWSPVKNNSFRISAGRGQRTANVLAENNPYMASSRIWDLGAKPGNYAFGFNPEVSWNFGLNYTRNFKFRYRKGSFGIDYYRTDFKSQVVTDLDNNVHAVRFYQLNGPSFSNSLQVDLEYEMLKGLDIRFSYRYLDVKTQYLAGLFTNPMIAKNRAFVNLAYEGRENIKKQKWIFDATFQYIGPKRIPSTIGNPEGYRLNDYSPGFFQLMGQVTRKFNKKLDVYIGVENATNFKQPQPILDGENPFGPYFDSSMVWGPIFGRMFYGGIRWSIR